MTKTGPASGEQLWLDQPGAVERAEREAPSTEIARHAIDLIERGYTVIPNCVPPDIREAAVAGFLRWRDSRREDVARARKGRGYLPRIVNLHLEVPEVLRLFTRCRRALAVQDFCFGYRTSLYSSLFYETGSQQSLHRDSPYFRTVPENFFFGMWVALEDVDLDNGPLFIMPRGHRVRAVDPHALGAAHRRSGLALPPICQDLWDSYQESVRTACRDRGLKERTLQVSRGDAVLWHPLAPHGGRPIVDPRRTRLSIVFHTTPEQVPVYQGDVFFDAEALPSSVPSWGYHEVDGRSVAAFDRVFFG